MEGDVSIARHGGDFYLDADAGLRESLGARLDKYLIADDARVRGCQRALEPQPCLRRERRRPRRKADLSSPMPALACPGHDVWIAGRERGRRRRTRSMPMWSKRCASSTAFPAGARNSRRTRCRPEAGPHMLAAISYTKGCYVGQETIARLKSVGHVNRSLVFLRSESADFPGARRQADARRARSRHRDQQWIFAAPGQGNRARLCPAPAPRSTTPRSRRTISPLP